jgi:peptide deformylase
MSVLNIVTIDPELLSLKDIVLRQCTKEIPIKKIEYLKLYRKLAIEMFEIMYANYGAALAAPQVGIPLRLVVMDPAKVDFGPYVLINPAITFIGDAEEADIESCLSLPHYTGRIFRSSEVCVSAYDLNGELKEYRAQGLAARILQHEIDHLNGILYPDKLKGNDYLVKSEDKAARRRAIDAVRRLQMAFR